MKTKKMMIITFATTLLFWSNFNANADNTEDGLNKKVKKYLSASIAYPENDESLSGFVIVEYKVDTVGNIGINAINSSNEKLKNHVVNSVQNLTCCPVAAIKDTSFICKYYFVSQEDYAAPKNNIGMNNIVSTKEYTAVK